MKTIILASSSKYRKQLLEQIGLTPNCINPKCDESDISESLHSPLDVALKRAELKAQSVAQNHPEKIVIGSDQLANHDGRILGKPHTLDNAFKQLKSLSGKTHELITSLVVIQDGKSISKTNVTKLRMKALTDQQIQNYIQKDQPIDCAGSYKIEKHGLWLFEEIDTSDQTAIQGISLIDLIHVLAKFDFDLLSNKTT